MNIELQKCSVWIAERIAEMQRLFYLKSKGRRSSVNKFETIFIALGLIRVIFCKVLKNMRLFVSKQMLVNISFDITASLANLIGITFSTFKLKHNVGRIFRYFGLMRKKFWNISRPKKNWQASLYNKTCRFWQMFSWNCWRCLPDKVTESSSWVAYY